MNLDQFIILTPPGLKNPPTLSFLFPFDLKFSDGDGPNLCRVKK